VSGIVGVGMDAPKSRDVQQMAERFAL